MRTVTDTPDTLILESRPSAVALLALVLVSAMALLGLGLCVAGNYALGLPFLAFGVTMVFIALRTIVLHTQLWINAAGGLIALRASTVWGFDERTFAFADLVRAEIQSTPGSHGQVLYRPVLILGGTDQEIVPVTKAYVADKGAEHAVATINTWLSRRA